MYFRLTDHYALRSWSGVICAYYEKNVSHAKPLTRRQADILIQCDGEHDIEINDTVLSLVDKGMIVSCRKGEHPSEWSSYKKYDNRYFPKMNLMITGKCNYNCIHCFNAVDNAPLMTEWSYEELCDLLDQARDCGIQAFTVTGGEPMVHPHFMDILRGIHERGMFVENLITNGSCITQDLLDEIKSFGCNPVFKISFDGVGYHDWMRGKTGAEEKTLRILRLCKENGFKIITHTQVNKKNRSCLMQTARLLDAIGIDETRFLRTTEVPRWFENAGDSGLNVNEYFETMLDFAKEYITSGMKMNIECWQYLLLFPKRQSFSIVPAGFPAERYRDSVLVCGRVREYVSITSSGEVVPCNQASGLLAKNEMSYGNLHRENLKDILSSGRYIDQVCMTVGDVRKNNSKCDSCKWIRQCGGGCRMAALLFSREKKDIYAPDPTQCMFFENGWYEKTTAALSTWKNQTPVE